MIIPQCKFRTAGFLSIKTQCLHFDSSYVRQDEEQCSTPLRQINLEPKILMQISPKVTRTYVQVSKVQET